MKNPKSYHFKIFIFLCIVQLRFALRNFRMTKCNPQEKKVLFHPFLRSAWFYSVGWSYLCVRMSHLCFSSSKLEPFYVYAFLFFSFGVVTLVFLTLCSFSFLRYIFVHHLLRFRLGHRRTTSIVFSRNPINKIIQLNFEIW